MAVDIPDGLRLFAWRIVADTSPRAYIVLAETAEEALACWRVGYQAAYSKNAAVPAAVDVVRVGVYLWPR